MPRTLWGHVPRGQLSEMPTGNRREGERERARTEDEPDEDPGRVVDAGRGRHERRAGEEDGDVDLADPVLWVLTTEVPEREREDGAETHRPQDRAVHHPV